MFGKRYPNCVKKTKKEEVELIDEKKGCNHTHKGEECDVHGKKECPAIEEAVRIPAKTGNLVNVIFRFRSSTIMLKMFFPQVSMPKRSDVEDQIGRVYPGAKLLSFTVSDYEPGQPVLHAEAAAWTRKAGKNKEVVLTRKAEDLTKEKIQEATLRHQARRLEIPVANHSALE